jgi:hypothetical protein
VGQNSRNSFPQTRLSSNSQVFYFPDGGEFKFVRAVIEANAPIFGSLSPTKVAPKITVIKQIDTQAVCVAKWLALSLSVRFENRPIFKSFFPLSPACQTYLRQDLFGLFSVTSGNVLSSHHVKFKYSRFFNFAGRHRCYNFLHITS